MGILTHTLSLSICMVIIGAIQKSCEVGGMKEGTELLPFIGKGGDFSDFANHSWKGYLDFTEY